MLPGGGKAALWLLLAPLSPEEGVLPPAWPPLTAQREPTRTTSAPPQQLRFVGVPAALPLSLFLSPGSKKSPGRSLRRPWHVHPLPAVAGNAPLGSHSDPQRGGLAAPRPLLQPRRGHPASSTRRTAQGLLKPGLGQQLEHVPALKGSRTSELNERQ